MKFMYKPTIYKVGTATLDLSALAGVKALLIEDGLYTPDQETDEFLDDIPVGARLANVAVSNYDFGTTDLASAYGDIITFSAPTSGKTVPAIVFYNDTGDSATSQLLGYSDEEVGLPLSTTGEDVIIAPNSALFILG